MSFRVEQKIPVSLSDGLKIINDLSENGLKDLYPERTISSDYFDTKDFNLFKDSEEGLLPRKKIRLRKYPFSENTTASFETKISSIEGRFKTSDELSKKEIVNLYKFGYFDQFYGNLEAKINVSYHRKYYSYKGMRITLDRNIIYKDLNSRVNLFFDPSCVIEIKAGRHVTSDHISELFSLHTRRFSKYCNGVQYLSLKEN
ncbi:polyphosphate polymerase domain-containing protein [Gammaproteobacteria bacterium]|nr:polyphosphate polymerase domain-containing protein [Gammaproteobacteria bacterium]MDB9859526.1 polyphosphate polymerase domain-containing protein [Gammaproteobacteria bacterium]